jgi:MYXO-CTERM domain-containing protein
MGFDVITAMGHRNIQMVTPNLTAYTTPIGASVEGGNTVLNLTFAPEPGGSAMLGFGVAALGLIHSVRRRKDH